MTVSEESISVWICLSMLESRVASVAPFPSSERTAISLPDSAVFIASRNAFALSGSMAFRMGPSSFRNCPMSPASCVWVMGTTSSACSGRPLPSPG